MSKLPKPEPIGTVPCPITGCAQALEVFKYRERGTRGSPFKRKFYARCPQHGRVIDAIARFPTDPIPAVSANCGHTG